MKYQNIIDRINNEIDFNIVDKHSENINRENGSVNIALKFHNDVILSINGRIDMDDIIGFNIIRNRELLISDFQPISNISKIVDMCYNS